MTPERWQAVREIFDLALELTPAKRESFLNETCAADSALRQEVLTLLASIEEAGDFLETPASDGFSEIEQDEEEPEPHWAGQRLGHYEIIAEVGRGGMGVVYRGVRTDDYRKEVALKLIKRGLDTDFILQRFRNERQILATLDHPNIARLLDGGATAYGQPYLVMEFIQGLPLDRYCEQHALSATQRLELFRIICSAVHAAHRSLIVHRDIKPSNILITSEGTPKLLDFGVAKILSEDANSSMTSGAVTAVRLLTPEYASPEQIDGGTITTSSDVYSLGVLLHELLTGRRPIEENSVQGPRLPGDLDNIVHKALEPEPERRYASVEHLSEDIRRYLEGLPVMARRPTLAYRTGKFVKRHFVGVSLVALVLVIALAGVAATLRQARIANQQRARAERRFNDVRQLANALFPIHDAVQHLPGSTPARKLIIQNALRYLDSLSGEASGDSSLQRELAGAYYKLAKVQGDTEQGNLGDSQGSLISFRKAAALWDAVVRANPNNIDDQISQGSTHRFIGMSLRESGQSGGDEELRRAFDIGERLRREAPADRRVHWEIARNYEILAGIEENRGQFAKAVEYLRLSYGIAESEIKTAPKERRAIRGMGVQAAELGEEVAKLGLRQEAMKYLTEALEKFEALASDSTDAQASRELAVVEGKAGQVLLQNGDPEGALKFYRHAGEIGQKLLAADPQNAMLRMDTGGSYLSMGTALGLTGKVSESSSMLDRAIQTFTSEMAANPTYTDLPYLLALSYQAKGDLLYHCHRSDAALANYRIARTGLEKLASLAGQEGVPQDVASAVTKIAAVLAKSGHLEQASQEYHAAVSLARPLFDDGNLAAAQPLAESYLGLAKLEEHRGASNAACSLYRQSLDVWKQAPDPGTPDVSGLMTRNRRSAEQAVASCR